MQSTVGTIVKSGDHGEPIGVLSALNTQRYKDLQCLKEIRTYLTRNCKAESKKAALEKASCLHKVLDCAWLSERESNCTGPPPSRHSACFQHLKESQSVCYSSF